MSSPTVDKSTVPVLQAKLPHFYHINTANSRICGPVWHLLLTKSQTDWTEAIQKRLSTSFILAAMACLIQILCSLLDWSVDSPASQNAENNWLARFLARDSIYAIARYMPSPVRLAIRPSVCPSHWWISQRRFKIGSRNLHHSVAPWF